ncbi:MAG: hypothetical protein IJZ95_05715 [Oscillospiraceae bacterium]|nr:hypothetical protein [Oscillospiraceae bacterium]
MSKDYYTQLISLLSNRYGSELIEMLDRYNKHGLNEITEVEAKEYYESLIAVKSEQTN